MQQENASSVLSAIFCCNVAIFFPQRFDISVQYFSAILPGEEKWGLNREKWERERETGKISTQSRRVADVNLLHPDEAKSKGEGRSEEGSGRQGAT